MESKSRTSSEKDDAKCVFITFFFLHSIWFTNPSLCHSQINPKISRNCGPFLARANSKAPFKRASNRFQTKSNSQLWRLKCVSFLWRLNKCWNVSIYSIVIVAKHIRAGLARAMSANTIWWLILRLVCAGGAIELDPMRHTQSRGAALSQHRNVALPERGVIDIWIRNELHIWTTGSD